VGAAASDAVSPSRGRCRYDIGIKIDRFSHGGSSNQGVAKQSNADGQNAIVHGASAFIAGRACPSRTKSASQRMNRRRWKSTGEFFDIASKTHSYMGG
jgi:hypothetical protein